MSNYKTVLLKVSGESLKNGTNDIWNQEALIKLCGVVKKIQAENIKVGIVIGGGNIFRGRVSEELKLDRVDADYCGMNATNLNGMMLRNVFNKNGIPAILYSEISVEKCIEKYDRNSALNDLENGKCVIFAGGYGLPYYSTDTGAASKACDIGADVIVSGKHGVDGIYDLDPSKNKNAKKYEVVSYRELIENNTQAVDIEALKICEANNIIMRVVNEDYENFYKVIFDDKMGTTIRKE